MLFSFPEKLYVGFQEVGLNTSNPPLSFITPYGTDKAFEKRKETVWNWCNDVWGRTNQHPKIPKIDPVVLDNVELSGYTLDTVVERYTTSNKVFRITDPRGFQFEIYADNLADILLNGEISHGKLIGNYIFARSGANNFLMREDHPANIERTTPSFDRPLQVGDVVSMSGASKAKMLFCGMFYKIECIVHKDIYYTKTKTIMRATKSKKPVMVFYNMIYGRYLHAIHTVENTKKYSIISEGHPIPSEDIVPIGKMLVFNYAGLILLETKSESDNFNPTIAEYADLFGMKIDSIMD